MDDREHNLFQRVHRIDENREENRNLHQSQPTATDKINEMIRVALERGASDIHLEPSGSHLIVKLRCNGKLGYLEEITGEVCPQIMNRIKVMAEMNSVEKRLPQDGHLSVLWEEHVFDIRVSSLPLFQGEKMVLRILGRQDQLRSVRELGFSNDNMARMSYLMEMPGGMVLVCGPTGSGKTTTLYSMLAELRESGKNIITLEDPVEYEMTGVNQVQINERTGLTFSRGLRSILRQDPDIIMVGEIRDPESAEIAVRLAYTGHLVLASLHTGDAISAINRMVELGIAPHMIASCLNGVIAQRLVRCIENDRNEGRIAIQEILICNDDIRYEISHYESFMLRKKEIERGYPTLLDDGLRKLDEGLTSFQALKEVLGPMMDHVERVWM